MWLFALIAALACGTIAWAIGETMLIPEVRIPKTKGPTNTDLGLASESIRNGVIASTVLGTISAHARGWRVA